MKTRRTNTFLALIGLALLLATARGGGSALAQPAATDPLVLSAVSSDCSNPKIALIPGGDTAVVWQGEVDGRSRILFRRQFAGQWTSEQVVDQTLLGENTDPALAIDAQGNAHIVWCHSDDGQFRIHYTFQVGNRWMEYGTLNPDSTLNSEFPVITIDGLGRVLVAWQEGNGTLYSIKAAMLDGSGPVRLFSPTGDAPQHYNLYPQLFSSPDLLLTWYEAQVADFSLRAARFDEAEQKFVKAPLDDFTKIAANRLPKLFRLATGQLVGLWYDTDGLSDRIFLGVEEAETAGAGIIVDDNPSSDNHLPSGDGASLDNLALCWVGEAADGKKVFVANGSLERLRTSAKLSAADQRYNSHPDLALDENSVHVVWYSGVLDGGSGKVYYSKIPLASEE
ncbi:MAG: hypothetical protein V2A74_09120 [bacterium]